MNCAETAFRIKLVFDSALPSVGRNYIRMGLRRVKWVYLHVWFSGGQGEAWAWN